MNNIAILMVILGMWLVGAILWILIVAGGAELEKRESDGKKRN